MRTSLCAILVSVTLLAAASAAAEPFVYPAKGQSEEQATRDKGECRQWAVDQSGIDPASVSSTGARKSVVGGAAKGAALGAIGGAIGGGSGGGGGGCGRGGGRDSHR